MLFAICLKKVIALGSPAPKQSTTNGRKSMPTSCFDKISLYLLSFTVMAYRVAAPAATSAALEIEVGCKAWVTATSAAHDLPW